MAIAGQISQNEVDVILYQKWLINTSNFLHIYRQENKNLFQSEMLEHERRAHLSEIQEVRQDGGQVLGQEVDNTL